MEQNYISALLIKYIYGETDIADRLELEYALENDSTLRREYLDLYNSYSNIPKVAFSPKRSTMDNILNHSRSTSLETN